VAAWAMQVVPQKQDAFVQENQGLVREEFNECAVPVFTYGVLEPNL
jgi:hypothetical protein